MLRATLWALAIVLIVEAMLLLLIPERLRDLLAEATAAQLRLVGIIEVAIAAAVVYVLING